MIAVVSSKAGREKLDALKAVGVEIVLGNVHADHSDPEFCVNKARHIARGHPRAWFADQFNNPDNEQAHFRVTGPEIWEQMNRRIDVLIGGMGTGGTLCGTSRFLKLRRPSLVTVLADPVGSSLLGHLPGQDKRAPSPYLVEGIGNSFVPAIVDFSLIDDGFGVSDQHATEGCRFLLEHEGIFAGMSSGCIVAATVQYCRKRPTRLERDSNIVIFLPDGGRSYLNGVYNEEWRINHGIEWSRSLQI